MTTIATNKKVYRFAVGPEGSFEKQFIDLWKRQEHGMCIVLVPEVFDVKTADVSALGNVCIERVCGDDKAVTRSLETIRADFDECEGRFKKTVVVMPESARRSPAYFQLSRRADFIRD